MRAYAIDEFGQPGSIRELPDPAPPGADGCELGGHVDGVHQNQAEDDDNGGKDQRKLYLARFHGPPAGAGIRPNRSVFSFARGHI